MDEFSVHTLDVGQNQQLLDASEVPHVAFKPGVGITPLLRGPSKECHVQKIGFVGVGDGSLCRGDECRNEVRLDGVGVDAVVKLGKSAI